MKPLSGLRILVCGKGGSGKSSIVTLMANVLQDKDYRILLLDGDASNPGGLARLAFGLKNGPKHLIEFFGGREKVECPVDDPSPLTRKNDSVPVPERHIDLAEIHLEYYIQKEKMTLLQVGKIQRAFEGCDGPMSKVTRDFIVEGDFVTLIDVEAGIEHFGRGIEQNVDVILITVNPTFESFAIADRVSKLCRLMRIDQVWAILNDVPSEEIGSMMMQELQKREVNILGKVQHDDEIARAGLVGSAIIRCKASQDLTEIIEKLEESIPVKLKGA